MALIKCPDCDKQVSTSAAACPNCGAPVKAARETKAAGAPLTTTQLTSKKFKGQQVVAVLMIIVGAVWLSVYLGANANQGNGAGWAILTLLVGMIWYIVIRIRTWWHHG